MLIKKLRDIMIEQIGVKVVVIGGGTGSFTLLEQFETLYETYHRAREYGRRWWLDGTASR